MVDQLILTIGIGLLRWPQSFSPMSFNIPGDIRIPSTAGKILSGSSLTLSTPLIGPSNIPWSNATTIAGPVLKNRDKKRFCVVKIYSLIFHIQNHGGLYLIIHQNMLAKKQILRRFLQNVYYCLFCLNYNIFNALKFNESHPHLDFS